MNPMKRSWSTILLIGGLVGLLAVLGVLQYRWQTQIGENEGDKMHKRLQEETDRFAADFNREIQNAYFNFQIGAEDWRTKNYSPFNERFDFWKGKATYPELISDFYFFDVKPDVAPLRYDREAETFEPVAWTPELRDLQARFADDKNFRPVYEDIYTLVLPQHEEPKKMEHILIRTPTGSKEESGRARSPMLEKFGYLAIRLDPGVVKDRLLPDLAAKYFGDGEFKLSVADTDGSRVFQTGDGATAADATAGLFDLSPNDVMFFANREVMSKIGAEHREGVVMNARVESRTFNRTTETGGKGAGLVKIEVQQGGQPKSRIFTTSSNDPIEHWTLSTQHRDGSIDAYLTNLRTRNLGIGFGILSLLGLAVGAVIVSAQRAKAFAQRQVDFVSSVSHEFRTPLAVIYSAGENLADGVAADTSQVESYGELIKGEGRKLASMVEQILEFAGANSGRQKYNFAETGVADVVNDALNECSPLIRSGGFEVKTDIQEPLPLISADRDALSRAVQNLIANAVKYSNGSKWLRVSAVNGSGTMKISVEDRGRGISKADQRQIFEPFFRAKEVVDAQIHGNGLGLSLVKQIADAHGGRVVVESKAGEWSIFTIELPQEK